MGENKSDKPNSDAVKDSSSQFQNPWKTIGTALKYANNWIRVREDQVIRPDGNPGIYGVVETRMATAVIALTPKREVYLVGQYRYPTKHYSWEIIEGGTEHGEEPRHAAERELEEEAGLKASKWCELGEPVHLSNCYTDEVGYFFLAQGLTSVPARPEGTEVLVIEKKPFSEVMAMVEDGIIKDMLTIVGIYRLERYLRKNKL